MKINYKFLILFIIINFNNLVIAQTPSIEWQKTIGGTNIDEAFSILQTSDLGYIIVGNTLSNNIDVTGNHGLTDVFVVKLNNIGDIEWKKCIGGSNNEEANHIIKTQDGGYMIAGNTKSNNGDVTDNQGNRDAWIVKLNSGGNIIWQKTFGGTNDDRFLSVIQNSDGSYVACGNTFSNNGDISNNNGGVDSWVVKINTTGNLVWQKTFGGSNNEIFYSIDKTFDGGFILAGATSSINGNITSNLGEIDIWVVKLNSLGNLIWQKTFGGSSFEGSYSITQTLEGGYIVSGYTSSNNGNLTSNNGGGDSWILKLNSVGNITWQKNLGGSGNEFLQSVFQTKDGGYISAGFSSSNNGDIISNQGSDDYWVIKFNSIGNIVWQKSLGGTDSERVYSIKQSFDNGYIIAGNTNSNNGDVTNNKGLSDYWVVKLAPDTLSNNNFIENTTISLFPNPVKEKITLKLDYFSPSQEIYITDVLGKNIHNQKIEGLSTTINTSNFEKGIYFLNLKDGSKKTTKKFIVE